MKDPHMDGVSAGRSGGGVWEDCCRNDHTPGLMRSNVCRHLLCWTGLQLCVWVQGFRLLFNLPDIIFLFTVIFQDVQFK